MNIDKVKNSLGVDLFEYICSLSTENLKSMLIQITEDINQFSEIYDYRLKEKRRIEKWLIEYRLN